MYGLPGLLRGNEAPRAPALVERAVGSLAPEACSCLHTAGRSPHQLEVGRGARSAVPGGERRPAGIVDNAARGRAGDAGVSTGKARDVDRAGICRRGAQSNRREARDHEFGKSTHGIFLSWLEWRVRKTRPAPGFDAVMRWRWCLRCTVSKF